MAGAAGTLLQQGTGRGAELGSELLRGRSTGVAWRGGVGRGALWLLGFSESCNRGCAWRPDVAVTSAVRDGSSFPCCKKCSLGPVADHTVCSRLLQCCAVLKFLCCVSFQHSNARGEGRSPARSLGGEVWPAA